jgi:hypothetical protein
MEGVNANRDKTDNKRNVLYVTATAREMLRRQLMGIATMRLQTLVKMYRASIRANLALHLSVN